MQVGTILEVYTTMYGWELYYTIADLFSTTGLMWAPFLAVIYRNVKGPVTSQDNKAASTTSLARMQWDVYLLIFLIIIAFYPLMNLSISELKYTKVCTDTTTNTLTERVITTTDSTYEAQMPKQTNVKVPIFWYLAMSIGSGTNYHTIGNIPCFEDVPWFDEQLRNLMITDEKVSKEYSRFINECFIPAKNKYVEAMNGKNQSAYVQSELDAGRPSGGWWSSSDPYDQKDPYFMGSHFYLETPGFYKPSLDPATQGHGFRARLPIEGWLYDTTRDKDYSPDMLTKGEPGSPYCDEWWEHPTIGLEKKLLDNADAISPWKLGSTLTFWESLRTIVPKFFPGTHDEETQDIFIKGLSFKNNEDFSGSNEILGDSTASKAVFAILASPSIAGHYSDMSVAKHAAPMVQAVLLLVIYMLLPIVMVISCYDLKVLFTAFFLIITVKFFSTVWEISTYLDASLFVSMYPDVSILGSIETLDAKRAMLDMILTGMIVVAPILLVGILGMTGYQFGKIADSMGASMKGARDTGKAAGAEAAGKAKAVAIKKLSGK